MAGRAVGRAAGRAVGRAAGEWEAEEGCGWLQLTAGRRAVTGRGGLWWAAAVGRQRSVVSSMGCSLNKQGKEGKSSAQVLKEVVVDESVLGCSCL